MTLTVMGACCYSDGQMRQIVGRTVGSDKDWHVTIPIFADVNGLSEVEG